MKVKNKRILKQIAKEWAKGILLAAEIDSEFTDDILTNDEQKYIVDHVKYIANNITDTQDCIDLDSIISKFFEFRS